ncbi:uncharacterized protein LACBIDRAFT_335926 [Laccaria bicolor S238N-H82]|uniref:Predicted protein n=1 Tax=Laccaria bicolor (strain S238N-H82 / ATCC MYA-4686) TaxID=486041 RepID=B0E3V2_LACBS|nr:uncharacterized protein LACBIDRAFT_335926 [Laccaria bicolor S238N-H82]EDQ98478.1 predicted protein [Laccaria bicolor S238N-H82]|eukprot:XP_001890870.1 predicted protein [Laccaria bicolor S238N-H82]
MRFSAYSTWIPAYSSQIPSEFLDSSWNLWNPVGNSGGMESIAIFQQRKSLPTAYTAWLQLMVAHFDAVEIIVEYMQKHQCHTVSVDILVAPAAHKSMLLWRDLFLGNHLPNTGMTGDFPSQDDIRQFLEEGVTRAAAANFDLALANTAC